MREGWKATTLAELLDPVKELVGDSGVELVLSVTEGRGIIPQTEVFKNRIATSDLSKYKRLAPFDVAFNPYLLWTGAVGQWLGDAPGATSPVYEAFRARQGVDPRFVGLVLTSGLLTPYFDSTAVGSIQRRRRTTIPVFMAAPVTLPPIDAQRRIVDVLAALDQHLIRIDVERIALKRVQAATAREAWSLATTGDWTTLGACTSRIKNGVMYKRGEGTGGLPVTRIETMSSGRIDMQKTGLAGFDEMNAQDFLLEAGDILFSNKNSLERVGTVALTEPEHLPLVNGDNVLQIRCTVDLLPEFAVALLRSTQCRQYIRSITRPAVNQASVNAQQVAGIPIPVPSLEEQRPIASAYLQLDRHGVALDREAQRLKSARSVVLASLLSGTCNIPESYDVLLGKVA